MVYIIIAIVILLLAGSIWGGKKIYTNIIDRAVKEREAEAIKGYQDEIDRLNRIIKEKETLLRLSEQRYSKVMNKIKEVAQRAENIQPPESNTEIRKRLKDLGYETR